MSIQQLRNLTTLCYIEQDGKYLMLHRVKKENDHAMDDMRYFVRTAMQRTLREYRMPPADDNEEVMP